MAKNKKKYIIYAVFGVAILFVAFWGFNFLKGLSVFDTNDSYYIYYERVDGLNKGNPVSINGYSVGMVTNIELLPEKDCQLKVTIAVKKQYKIPLESIARIESTDLLGSKGIELEFNKNINKYHNSGDELKGSIEYSLKDQVSIQMLPVKQKAEELMMDMSSVMVIIKQIFNEQTQSNIKQSITKLKTTISSLEHAIQNLDTLIDKEAPKFSKIIADIECLTETLRSNKSEIENIVKNFSYISDTISKLKFSETINNANSVLENIDGIVQKINNGNGTISELINNDKLIRELEITVANVNKLLVDIKANPQKYVHFSLIDRKKIINVSDTVKNK